MQGLAVDGWEQLKTHVNDHHFFDYLRLQQIGRCKSKPTWFKDEMFFFLDWLRSKRFSYKDKNFKHFINDLKKLDHTKCNTVDELLENLHQINLFKTNQHLFKELWEMYKESQ